MPKFTVKVLFLALAVVLTTSLGLAGGAPGAWAQPGDYPRQEQRLISQSRAASLVKQRYGGKVLKVQRSKSGNKITYRVKLLQESGRVRQVVVDAQTGAILGG